MIKRIFFCLILIILMLMGIMALIIYMQRDRLTEYTNIIVKQYIHPDIQIGYVGLNLWGFWRGTEVELRQLTLTDSLYHIHKRPLLKAGKVEVGFKFWPLLSKRLEIGRVILDSVDIHLFTDQDMYSNKYLLSKPQSKDTANNQRDTLNKRKWYTKIENISLYRSRIRIIDRSKGKDYHFWINKLQGNPDMDKEQLKANLNIDCICRALMFNSGQGSFLSQTHIRAEPKVNILPNGILKVHSTEYDLSGTKIIGGLMFGLRELDTLDIVLDAPSVSYGRVVPMLTPAIQKSLKLAKIYGDLKANAHIRGRLSDATPKVNINFDMNQSEALTPYFDLKNLSLKGSYLNQANPKLPPSDPNSQIKLSKVVGKSIDIDISTPLVTIHNLSDPNIETDIKLNGNVKALSKFVKEYPFKLIDGNFLIQGYLNTKPKINIENLLNVKGQFKFENVSAVVPKYGIIINKLNCNSKYQNKRFVISNFGFKVNNIADKSGFIRFLSRNSSIKIFDKVMLMSDFVMLGDPKIFNRFLTKKGVETTEGSIKFEGYFDDYIRFSPNQLPNVSGLITLQNIGMWLPNQQMYINQTNSQIQLSPKEALILNLDTRIHRSLNPNSEGIKVNLHNSKYKLNQSNEIEANFDIESSSRELSQWIPKEKLELNNGYINITGSYIGSPGSLIQNLRNIDAKVMLKNADIMMPQLNLNLFNTTGTLKLFKSKIEVVQLATQFLKNKIELTFKSNNLIKYLFDKGKIVDADLYIYSKKIDLSTTNISSKSDQSKNESYEVKSNKTSPFLEQMRRFNLVNIYFYTHIEEFKYNSLNIYNLRAKGAKDGNKLWIENGNMRLGSHEISFRGAVTQRMYGINEAQLDIDMPNSSWSDVKESFSHWIPSSLLRVYPSGQFGLVVNLNAKLSDSLKPLPNSINGNYMLYTQGMTVGGLQHVFNIKPKFLFNRAMKCICIDPLMIRSYIKNDTLLIPTTNIKTQFGDAYIGGYYDLKSSHRLQIDIPRYNIQNILFGKNIYKTKQEVKQMIHVPISSKMTTP